MTSIAQALRWLPIGLALTLAGCVEFESQTLSYRYDPATDTLRAFQDYHGIFGADAKGDPSVAATTEEETQIESVWKGQRTFFFTNWILEFNREDVEDTLAGLKDPGRRSQKKLSAPAAAKLETLFRLLLANVRIENGPFYLDSRQKLCAVQTVTVSNCTALIAAANEAMPSILQAEAAGKEPAKAAPLLEFAAHPRPFVHLDGNAVIFQWPTTQEEFNQDFGEKAPGAEQRRVLLHSSFANGVGTIQLGNASDKISRVSLNFSKVPYTPNLVGPARQKHTVLESFDPVSAEEKFLLHAAGPPVR